MRYEREELINYPVGKLIDIILQQQEENEMAGINKRKLIRISRIINEEIVSSCTVSDKSERVERRGRPAYTPEQRAAAYEEVKRKKREEYAAKKAQKLAEENN